MHIRDSFAAVQLLEHRLVHGVAKPFVTVVGLQVDAVGLDGVEGIVDFLERHVDIDHRQRCEDTEATGEVLSHLGCEVVTLTDGLPSVLATSVEPQARCGGE